MKTNQALKVTLLGITAACIFAPSARAISTLNPAETVRTGGPVLIADALCGYQGGAIQSYETTNYEIYICSQGGNLYYVGLEKGNEANNNIYLPIESFKNGTYTAVNGEYRYSINSTKLVVTQNGRVVGQEKVLETRR